MTHTATLLRSAALLACAGFALLSIVLGQSVEQFVYSWSFDDMVSDCKAAMSVQVRIPNDSSLHTVSFTLSTGLIINNQLKVHTHRCNFTAKNRVPCLYHGVSTGTGYSVFGSLIRGVLNMTFKHEGTWYRSSKAMNNSEPALAQQYHLENETPGGCRSKRPPNEFRSLNLSDADLTVAQNPVVRKKRALTLQSFDGAVPQKVLELVVVLDRSFVNKAGSEGSAVTRVMQITNYVNGVYQTFKLRVVLTNIIIWSSDAFTVTNSPDETLNNFTLYKAMQVLVRYDTVILLSAVQWNSGTTLGLAWINALCDRLYAAGIVADKYPEAISTAWTLAHEVGHNLGFSHVEDVTGCTCSKTGGCVMNSYLSPAYRLQVLDWATCTVAEWNSQVNSTWRTCLADMPDTSYYSSRSAMCGNGILETGEQCDCGPAETCNSLCCDASTCRLKSGAVCASGPCCDSSSCTLRLKGDICRSAVGVCDVPETCSGSSELCPSDERVADGVECVTGQAYCYNGQCKSTDAQCQTIFSTAATTASSTCFSTMNTRGDVFGHCDMRMQSVSYVGTGFNRTFTFASCSVANTGCGLLHCFQSPAPSTGSRVTIGSANCYSYPRMDLSPSGLRSPSFVPDGAKCGTSSMCINSTCTLLSTVRNCPTCPNCNSNGVLTTGRVCFCSASFSPPYCNSTGCGGSVTSPLACFDPSRTTARPMTTARAETTISSLDSGGTPATILGLPTWQFIAIAVSIAAAVVIVILAVTISLCAKSKKNLRRPPATSPMPPKASPARQQQRHPQPQPQQLQPVRPIHPPPRNPSAPGYQQQQNQQQQNQQQQYQQQQYQQQQYQQQQYQQQHQQPQQQFHQNMGFRPDQDFSMAPPPYQVTPSAPPPPPSAPPQFPSVYTVPQSPHGWTPRGQQRY